MASDSRPPIRFLGNARNFRSFSGTSMPWRGIRPILCASAPSFVINSSRADRGVMYRGKETLSDWAIAFACG